MRVMMVIASAVAYLGNEAVVRGRYAGAAKMDFEAPLTQLVWVTSILSVVLTYVVSWLMVPELGDGSLWWKLSTVITCGTLAGAIIPELVKVFTSTNSAHVREVVTASREGGAVAEHPRRPHRRELQRLLAGAGHHGPHDRGLPRVDGRPGRAHAGAGRLRLRPGRLRVPGHGPGHDRRRLLRARHRQRAVRLRALADRGDPRRSRRRSSATSASTPNFAVAKDLLEENDGAGNTFKATAKPVLIGTAVVGATTMIFSIIVALTHGLTRNLRVPLHPAPAVPARADHRRRRHLLVHGRVHAGGLDRRLPRGGVHQGQHQARRHHARLGGGQPPGRGDLHDLRAEGDVQHLPGRVLLHARLRLRGAVLLHRVPDLHRALRPLPGHLHGQRGRSLGQRQEDRGDGAEDEGDAAPRRDRSWATPWAIPSRTRRRWP